jgi:hypothetical protein
MRVQVSVQPPAVMAGPTFAPGRAEYIDADQTFRITGARGTGMLAAWSGVGALKAIRRDGADLLGTFFELKGTERIDGIEIVLTTETGSLSGSVVGSDGRPATNAWVVIFPENPKLWYRPFVSISRTTGVSPLSVSSRPPQAAPQAASPVPGMRAARSPGEFFFGRLVSGRYYVATLDATDNASVPLPDPEFLASLKPQATAVTVVAGETATVAIRQ